jgi:hypothetical protein
MSVLQAMHPAQRRWMILFFGAYASVIVSLLAFLVMSR